MFIERRRGEQEGSEGGCQFGTKVQLRRVRASAGGRTWVRPGPIQAEKEGGRNDSKKRLPGLASGLGV